MNGGIDLVLPSFESGGAERVMVNLAVALHARGERVRLVVIDGRGPLRNDVPAGIDVVDLGRTRARSAAAALVLVIRRARPDAILSSQTHLNILLAVLRPLLPRGVRLVVREPLMPDAGAGSRIEALLLSHGLRRADAVIASSAAMRIRLVRIVGRESVIHLVPNPVDVDTLRSAVRVAHEPSSGEASRDRPVRLVSVGRLVPQKGHADLLDALAQPASGDATLDVIGEGLLRTDLEDIVRELGIEERVRFHGRIDDRASLALLLARADALVHPAHFEGMPNTVLEALALGTPVLATTDLTMLSELMDEVLPDAMRLVPRATLATAIGSTTRRSEPVPRQCLLPERFKTQAVADAVLDLLRPAGSA
jgi:glycosyltransferase involved in cell wall biosynthesis